mmetsp:Transcript_27420/g.75558  ORF Transcript_27420/g.75558 Transcript_27420/m.75558 type:complete len:535 (-) Transcript_27420:737-2341(-)|eukprot:CAMPEP_0168742316 /NCGR_PEP_ID=MMETSP0724-20121128/12972_1 /TAXON_ID=265536 /ORGANISM="Amphiprora sp., Strain CCMP467" /LENGTH=534 /DNA_ID=CAMNT_0008789859 /DNA_START=366 /DNA_END=1970 /DNA_ORIENTATION=-
MSVASPIADELPIAVASPIKKRIAAPKQKDGDGTVPAKPSKKLCADDEQERSTSPSVDEKRAAAQRHARDRRFSKDGTAPKLSKEQRERKRMINRLSAQRKREKERYQLDTLTDEHSKLSYLNATLQADNSRLEKLRDQLRLLLVVHQQQRGAASQGVMMKLDTLEQVRAAVLQCAEEPAPSKATIYDACSTVEQEANWPASPFLQTTEALKEKLSVLDTSKVCLMTNASAVPSSADVPLTSMGNLPLSQARLPSVTSGAVNNSEVTSSLQALLNERSNERSLLGTAPIAGDVSNAALEHLLRGGDRTATATAAAASDYYHPTSSVQALLRGSVNSTDSEALASAAAILRGTPLDTNPELASASTLERLLRGSESAPAPPAGAAADFSRAAELQNLLRGPVSAHDQSSSAVLASLLGKHSASISDAMVQASLADPTLASLIVRSIGQNSATTPNTESLLALNSISALQDPTLTAMRGSPAAQALLRSVSATGPALTSPSRSATPSINPSAQQTTPQHMPQNERMLQLLQSAFRR